MIARPLPIALALALTVPLMTSLAAPLAATAETPVVTKAAADAPDAQALYNTNCVRCHQSEVFTRPDRKITSLPALNTQVHRCETMLELHWFDEDVDAVTAYVNDHYYHFKP